VDVASMGFTLDGMGAWRAPLREPATEFTEDPEELLTEAELFSEVRANSLCGDGRVLVFF
jgi:hypothetical protein